MSELSKKTTYSPKQFSLKQNRRDFIKFLSTSTLASSLVFNFKSQASPKKSKIKGLKPSTKDQLILAEGLTSKILIQEGDALTRDLYFGTNNDFTQFIKLKNGKFGLWVNHEAFTCALVSNRKRSTPPTKEQYLNERKLLGGSFFEIQKKEGSQEWTVVTKSGYNNRLSGESKIPFSKNQTVGESKFAIGTFANCSGGLTPWNTILTCEENYQHYYGEKDRKTGAISENKKSVLWNRIEPLDPRHYGWVVEYDPETKKSKKLLGLGRFSHECAKTVVNKDGFPVVYSGDDTEEQCLYKFVSKNKNSLDEGELFVASLEQKKWISLDINKNPILKKNFKNQLEVLTYCREAAELVGGTKLARPEDIEIDPLNGQVYVALTNSKSQKNYHGLILKIIEKDNNYTSLEFEPSTFLTGSPKSGLSCPDNMVFDQNGNLWITSDMSGDEIAKGPYKGLGNNGLYVVPRTGPDAGKVIQLASAPTDAELTGPCFSDDQKTLFLSVQHPGELTPVGGPLTSHWPKGGTEKPLSAVVCIQGPLLESLTQRI